MEKMTPKELKNPTPEDIKIRLASTLRHLKLSVDVSMFDTITRLFNTMKQQGIL